MPDIIVDLDKCTGCGKCREVCAKLVYEPVKIDNKIKYLPTRADSCLYCTTCVNSCPVGAITLKKKNFKTNRF